VYLWTVCRLLDQERLDHTSLKRTWQMANDQFLASQRQLLADVRTMESILTAEQKMEIAGELCVCVVNVILALVVSLWIV